METKLELVQAPEMQAIPKTKADSIEQTFKPMVEMLRGFDARYSEIIDKPITEDLCKIAKRLRLDISKVRIKTEEIRVEQKAEYLRAGKAIDAVSNVLKWAVTDKEKALKEIETHYEKIEQARVQKIQDDREMELSMYTEDYAGRDLTTMDPDVWEAFIAAKKKHYDDQLAAEAKAEEDRKAAEEKVKQDQAKAEADRIALQKKLEAEKEKNRKLAEKQKADKAKADKKIAAEKAKAAKKLEAEKAKAKKLQDEIAAKKAAEDKAAAEAAQIKAQEEKAKADAIEAELSKGDEQKLQDLISDLSGLKGKYEFKAVKNKTLNRQVGLLLDKIVGHIKLNS